VLIRRSLLAIPLGVALGVAMSFVILRQAGATGLAFVSGQGCAAPDGSISLTWTVSNPTDFPYSVEESSVLIPSLIPAHGSASVTAVYPATAAGATVWADLSGRFVGHLGDQYYGTPGVFADLPWSDGASVVLDGSPCATPPPIVRTPDSTPTVTPATEPVTTAPAAANLAPEQKQIAAQAPQVGTPRSVTAPSTVTDVVTDVPCCPAGTSGSAPQLAFTGAGNAGLAALGAFLVAAGVGLLRLRRWVR
jgi:hypothetical protein